MRKDGPLDAWRVNVTKHRLTYALLAAFVSTHIATVSGFWYRIIELPNLSWPAFNGILLIPGESVTQQFWSGTLYHYLTGICYGLIFAYLIHPVMPIPNTVLGNIGKALIWGWALAFVSAGLWVAKNFPDFNPGFFSHNLGWKTVLGIFVWHGVYGLHLGAFYNPMSESAVAERTASQGQS